MQEVGFAAASSTMGLFEQVCVEAEHVFFGTGLGFLKAKLSAHISRIHLDAPLYFDADTVPRFLVSPRPVLGSFEKSPIYS